MNWFQLLPESVVALTQAVVIGSILIYLLSRRSKTRSTWMLVVMFTGMTLAAVVQDGVIDAFQIVFHPVIYWLDSFAGTLVFVGLINFAHAFQGQSFPRTSKVTFWTTGAYLIAVGATVGVLLDIRGGLPSHVELAFEVPNLLMAAGAATLFLKKKSLNETHISKSSSMVARTIHLLFHAESKETRALRAFSWFALALALVLAFGIWRILGSAPEWALTFFNLSFLPILLAFVLIYINHSAEPSTFQVKLVALSLYTVLALIAIATTILFPVERLRLESQSLLPDLHSVRFIPESDSTYSISQAYLAFDPDLGDRIDVTRQSSIDLNFDFPFYGNEQNIIHVRTSGLVSFGDPYDHQLLDDFYQDPVPKIAAFHAAMVNDVSDEGGIYFKSEFDRATVTWYRLREIYDPNSTNQNTIQLVLHADGLIEVVCERVDTYPRYGLRGLHPGGRSFPPSMGGFAPESDSYNSKGGLLHEDIGRLREAAFRRFTHKLMVPLVFIIIGSTIFIVLIFPLFFRVSLISPLNALLQGVRDVDKGDLETKVPVRTMDEIGMLTQGFNQMTRSLSEAKTSLKAHAENLERLKNRLHAENVYLQDEIRLEHNFQNIITRSKAFKKVLRQLEQVAETDATILILGESGTGKELIARAAHNLGKRSTRPLVKVNCAALPAELIESELFGHEKGAFTGAIARKIGRFELANGGTIFLDEIGEMPLDLQVKLLRVLQEGEFERLGDPETVRVDVRIIAATNRDLQDEMAAGRFREDLFYRLNVFPVQCPPLRERKEDIPLLVTHFVKRYSKKIGKEIEAIPQSVVDTLQLYDWPGNIRELENVMERAVITSPGKKLVLGDWAPTRLPVGTVDKSGLSLEEVERRHIVTVLERTEWRVSGEKGAAKILAINPKTLQSRMAKLGIERPKQNS